MDEVSLRTELRPDDVPRIVQLHADLHGQEFGFDATFADYVAAPLKEFLAARTDRQRMWLAERAGWIVGCVAIVAASAECAQLRWFLVVPEERGAGLGRRLLNAALDFSRESGYREVVLWTEARLLAAARLYESAGFRLVEEKPGLNWGVQVVEQRYELRLSP